MDSNNFSKAHIVFFSGTGGTKYAAKSLLTILSSKNINAHMSEIFQNNKPIVNENELLIIMFPVYAADAPYIVFEWISSIKEVKAQRAIVISVSGGGEVSPNTACRVRTIKQLEKKGFQITNEYMLCMPSNFIKPTEDNLSVRLLRILPKKCNAILEAVIKGEKRRTKPYKRDRILTWICQLEKLGCRFFGKTLKVSDKCTSCGLCSKNCPTANIKMIDNKPVFNWKCTLCMKCIYSCPQKAIQPRMLKSFVLKQGFDIKLYEERLNEDLKEDTLPNSKLWDGVIQYLSE